MNFPNKTTNISGKMKYNRDLKIFQLFNLYLKHINEAYGWRKKNYQTQIRLVLFFFYSFIFYFFKIQDEAEGYAMSGVKKYLLFLQKVFISKEPKQKTYEINVIFYMFCLK